MTQSSHSRKTGSLIANPPYLVFSRLCDALAILLLWALVAVFYWRIGLARRVLGSGDVFTYFYPYWAEATRAIQAGRLPLWNPYLFMGVPFLANSQAGVLYPLNWPLWLALPAHVSVHLTIVLHLGLAALNAYLLGRASLHLGPVGAWAVGVVFALGGYLGAQVEHVNQLQGLAWLPLALLLVDKSLISKPKVGDRSVVAFVGLAGVVGAVFLAGHMQTGFISLVGIASYALGPAAWRGLRRLEWRPLARRAAILGMALGLGVALAAVQLIPTWELSRVSIRARGLPFDARVSFSLSPFYLTRALLPGFAVPVPPAHIEHVAYVGIAGLALAVVALVNVQSGRSYGGVILAVLGLCLSLGRYNPLYLLLARFVPGFAHFRVPARWLGLYALGMAMLAGEGVCAFWHHRRWVSRRVLGFLAVVLVALTGWAVIGVRIGEGGRSSWLAVVGWMGATVVALSLLLLSRRAPRLAAAVLMMLLVIELFMAGLMLPHARATAPQAFTSLRPAIAHLLAGRSGRFISMSDITFDPGDLPEIEVIYGPQLSSDALYDYVVAAKQKEMLSPNLPLAFGVLAVDGYDGGVLPLERYVTLQRLFLPEGAVSIDGRLRENLTAVPDGRWLNLFNVRYVITDKLHDAWLDDVFYDLQFGARLARGETASVAHVPHFEATAVGVVSHLQGGAELGDDTSVGVVEVGFADGITRTFELLAGRHTAEGLYGAGVTHSQASVGGHFWPGELDGNDYVTRLRWREPSAPISVGVRATLPEGKLVVRGVSLIDERTGGFQSLVLSDRGRFRLAHSGDVKIYENLDVLPRAFIVQEVISAIDDDEALRIMRSPKFDPAEMLVLHDLDGATSSGTGSESASNPAPRPATSARVTHDAPERVEVELIADGPGYLVLADAWYPGWEATVDGESVPVRRVDLLFRAVPVDAGSQRVVFTFRSTSLRYGAVISLAGLVSLIVVAMMLRRFVQSWA